MAKPVKKKIDPRVKEVLQKQGFDWQECLWDCHGTWVMYHKYIEIAAAQNKITYDLHEVEFDTKNKIAVVKCNARLGDKTITTYGEAAPHNCKNTYTAAMAEKRAVDRAVLKLLGLHGFIYSEDEIDETKPTVETEAEKWSEDLLGNIYSLVHQFTDEKVKKEFWFSLDPVHQEQLREMIAEVKEDYEQSSKK